ncbi:murein DD-endopeptidase MepM/ murein hydrolase activator NlpD [Neisseria sp. HSC-16F19]|nr:M23 family metallopeptidase [Neisseria sp. HSC-16F19]MCP2041272.1 murein DD-endopeptidase MepM/ murein hydrolase activator NlpD [Neisseria sp. HSC-16F19]
MKHNTRKLSTLITRMRRLPQAWRQKPIRWSVLAIAIPVSSIMTAYAVTAPQPENNTYTARKVVENLPQIALESQVSNSSFWREEVVQSGDNLTSILTRLGVADRHIQNVIKDNNISARLLRLKPNQTISVRVNPQGDLTDIQFFNDDENGDNNLVALRKSGQEWLADIGEVETETLSTFKAVVIRTSARGALARARVPVEVRESLSELFSDKVDINQLQDGDTIRLLYNSLYFRGQELGTGEILGAEITHKGQVYQAYYFGDEDGSGQYYDAAGQPVKKGFESRPVGNARVSSPFGVRFHPILRTIKMHTGIDYAAPTGTPIVAPSEGVVEETGYKGGYGHTIVLRHNGNMQTLYAHMSNYGRFGVGSRVKAGDVIGYVGSTGRSTGPHLHYEVRINGQPVNPVTVAIPSKKLNAQELAQFKKEQHNLDNILATVRDLPITVAQLD